MFYNNRQNTDVNPKICMFYELAFFLYTLSYLCYRRFSGKWASQCLYKCKHCHHINYRKSVIVRYERISLRKWDQILEKDSSFSLGQVAMKYTRTWHLMCLDLILVRYGHSTVFVSMATLRKHVRGGKYWFFGANLGGCGFPNIMFILNKLLYAPSKAVVFHSLTYLLPLYAFKPLLLNVTFVVPGLCSNWWKKTSFLQKWPRSWAEILHRQQCRTCGNHTIYFSKVHASACSHKTPLPVLPSP